MNYTLKIAVIYYNSTSYLAVDQQAGIFKFITELKNHLKNNRNGQKIYSCTTF